MDLTILIQLHPGESALAKPGHCHWLYTFFFFFNIYFYLFTWLRQVLVSAWETVSCIMWDLVLQPEMEPGPPAWGVWSEPPGHQTSSYMCMWCMLHHSGVDSLYSFNSALVITSTHHGSLAFSQWQIIGTWFWAVRKNKADAAHSPPLIDDICEFIFANCHEPLSTSSGE